MFSIVICSLLFFTICLWLYIHIDFFRITHRLLFFLQIEKAYVHPESDAHIHMQIFRTNISSLKFPVGYLSALMSAVPPDLPLHDLRIFKASHPSPSQPPCSWPLCVSCSYGSPTRHKTRIPLWAISFSLRLVKCYSHTFTPPDFHHHRLSVGDNLCYFSSSLPSIWRQQISDATLLYSSDSSSVNYIYVYFHHHPTTSAPNGMSASFAILKN